MAFYTDGMTKSFNEAGEQFGESRLVEALRRHRELSPQDLLGSLLQSVRSLNPHEQHDDITMLVAKCR